MGGFFTHPQTVKDAVLERLDLQRAVRLEECAMEYYERRMRTGEQGGYAAEMRRMAVKNLKSSVLSTELAQL